MLTYLNTPFNYTGSKYNLLNQILPEFDYSKSYFVDLFTGGGSVYCNVVDKYEKIIANDIISDLIEIHKNLVNGNYLFVKNVKKLSPNKDNQEEYLNLRKSFNSDKSPEKLFALLLSCTNNMMRFNNSFEFNQTFGKRSYNDSTEKKINDFINHLKNHKDKIFFTSKSFEKIIPNNPSMIYIDPPYGYILNDDGTIGNKQLSEAGYNCYWKKENEIALYEYVLKINNLSHSFSLSSVYKHNNKTSWLVQKLIDFGFNYKEINYNYNKVSRKGDKKDTIEIILKNY